MDSNKKEQEKEVRDLLPFWAQELLTMKDKAEKKQSKKMSQLHHPS